MRSRQQQEMDMAQPNFLSDNPLGHCDLTQIEEAIVRAMALERVCLMDFASEAIRRYDGVEARVVQDVVEQARGKPALPGGLMEAVTRPGEARKVVVSVLRDDLGGVEEELGVWVLPEREFNPSVQAAMKRLLRELLAHLDGDVDRGVEAATAGRETNSALKDFNAAAQAAQKAEVERKAVAVALA
jgi:hypothetical protein